MSDDIVVRQMLVEDLDFVVEIENSNTATGWTKRQFQHVLDCSKVLIIDQQIIGFIVISTTLDQSELQNIAIHKNYQHLGYGEILLRYGINGLAQAVRQLFLEVRVTNFTAIRLYQKIGFTQVSVRRDYYPAVLGREDAIVMSLQTP
ncbi:MAG: ribosomal protein S18-alanine N-acetyltransferase [Porticoccaceae bacterium]|nr:ribosomal protein S18-alanine N-acetyltransferase [Porticoccaceae bacterium]MDG1474652.1 ribosomal protein S18-alanine N-acetyltransferase [Porticoccaceae bacterium]